MVVALAALLAGGAARPCADAVAVAYPATELVTQCRGKDGWSDPAPPARLFGNVHHVGTCGVVALLVTSPRGHILIDGATDAAAAGIADNIVKLGFRLADVRILLNSHEHGDHAAGLAALQRRTGARLFARAEARRPLETGVADAADPQVGLGDPFPGARVDRVIRDGEVVRLGPLALTAHATPGHTAGSTSWSWRSCENKACRSLVYADSLTALSNETYRFSDHPAYLAAFRATLDKVAALPCDILLTPHPAASRLHERLAGAAPLVDPAACRAYAAAARARLDTRLAQEASR